jgi:hypothetical protein|tara:strand:+ start:7005 stop:8030 length:1026 start_codon:yes stop_codon:yes gene_type:complete
MELAQQNCDFSSTYKTRISPYVKVDINIPELENLSPKSQQVFYVLGRFIKTINSNISSFTYSELKEKSNIGSNHTISIALKELSKNGLIQKIPGTKNNKSLYYVKGVFNGKVQLDLGCALTAQPKSKPRTCVYKVPVSINTNTKYKEEQHEKKTNVVFLLNTLKGTQFENVPAKKINEFIKKTSEKRVIDCLKCLKKIYQKPGSAKNPVGLLTYAVFNPNFQLITPGEELKIKKEAEHKKTMEILEKERDDEDEKIQSEQEKQSNMYKEIKEKSPDIIIEATDIIDRRFKNKQIIPGMRSTMIEDEAIKIYKKRFENEKLGLNVIVDDLHNLSHRTCLSVG